MRRPNSVSEALERLVGSFVGEQSEWDNVLQRAGRRPSRRRLVPALLVASAVLLAVIALAPPFGLAGRVVGLFRDEGKPVPVASLSPFDRGSIVFSFCSRLELVTPPGKAPEKRCLDGEPTIEEIANNGTRRYWKIRYPGGRTCVASGSVRGYRQYGGGRSYIGRMGCGGRNLFPTPKRPITTDVAIGFDRGDTRAKLYGLSGLAGEGVATVGLIEENGDVLKESVEGRTYDFERPPDRLWTAIVAFDDSGKEVYRGSLNLKLPAPRLPPADVKPARPRPLPLPPLPKEAPLQHATTAEATINIYRSGLVDLRLTSATSRAYRLLRPHTLDQRLPVSCFNLAYGAGQWGAIGSGSYGAFGRTTRAQVRSVRHGAATPPFDACSARGLYGRRWNDARGMHDPLEIAFTPLGRRFFAEQAAARDLSLFMRTPQIRAIRRAMIQKAGIPSAAEIARRFPSRVVPLAERTGAPPQPNIGVWSNEKDRIVAAKQAEDGRRMYATLQSGRFGPHNLGRLGFLIY